MSPTDSYIIGNMLFVTFHSLFYIGIGMWL
jgi:hypothetical protein